ncbi:MAG: type 1 glutamine amidotransferase [Candidatus Omnitrophica bacterium]|nr:type 1 glutamine amidotransferase [Candidatus Omnitrophota bacterium]
MILYLKNIDIEGAGTLGDFFERKGFESRTIDLGLEESLPDTDFSDIEALVVLGGPMNVYEEDKYPFLKQETIFIQRALEKRVPFLGLCLGSQLLVKSTGEKVTQSPQKEIGFFSIELTDAGKDDPLFKGLPETFEVFQWHEDMFHIPSQGRLLASSPACPHQAVKVGDNAYGLQFHVEITDVSIKEWCDKYIEEHAQNVSMKDRMIKDYRDREKSFCHTAEMLYRNFLEIIQTKK